MKTKNNLNFRSWEESKVRLSPLENIHVKARGLLSSSRPCSAHFSLHDIDTFYCILTFFFSCFGVGFSILVRFWELRTCQVLRRLLFFVSQLVQNLASKIIPRNDMRINGETTMLLAFAFAIPALI